MAANAQGIVFVVVWVVTCGIGLAAYSQTRWMQ
ncbi:hypothetical protein AWB70_01044 [Caballeronia cordobensis]|uniref:Uncharacterized protein n=1 Tax=Caballeronia cordobensis TaxID=1353886 RepID=A0A158FMX4_CABCO|nr:hypothetical protein AWB70_01044 [Caballeronia cordobensis]